MSKECMPLWREAHFQGLHGLGMNPRSHRLSAGTVEGTLCMFILLLQIDLSPMPTKEFNEALDGFAFVLRDLILMKLQFLEC